MMTQKQKHGLKAGVTVLMLVGGVCILPRLQATSSQSAVIVQEKQWRSPLITLDVRNAPVRNVLEMLFKVQGRDYAINSDVVSFVTAKTTEIPLENVLRLTFTATTPHTAYVVEGGVIYVYVRELISDGTNWMGPLATAPVHANTPLATVPVHANTVEDIKLQVSGVLFVNDLGTYGQRSSPVPMTQAILEIVGSNYIVVKVGDRVPVALKEGACDLIITKITPDGVTLETSNTKKQKIEVPLTKRETSVR